MTNEPPAPTALKRADPPPFNADDTLVSLESPARRRIAAAASVIGLAVYIGYLVYRAAFTLNPDAMVFSLLVFFAEVHGFVSLFLYFHQLWHLRKREVPAAPPGLKVDVFVTTYNEDVELLRQTLRAAVAIRYPHNTYVLDDGRRESVKALAAEVGCGYITRDNNKHAKAGNWNNAFMQTDADFIATFDADHVPRAEFLDRTLGFFRDAKVAIIQVPQQYHNLDSVQHKVSWKTKRMYGEQDSFFNLVMPGKDNWNAAFFCGTGAVLRREALVPHGGILTDTITEDLHTSVVLHAEGWKSVYLNEVLVTGLAPADLKTFAVQRLRWAEGNLKAASFTNPLTVPGLGLHQRISYFASLYHWTIGIPKLIYYLAPPWMLFSGTFPIANFDRTFVLVYLSFLGTLIASYRVVSRGKGRLLMDELFNMVSFFTLMRAMKRAVFGRGTPGKFEVTSKRGSGGQDLTAVLPHLALLGFSGLAITWSLMGLGFGVSDDVRGAITAIFWTLYNATLMAIVLKMALRPSEKRAGCRFRANFAVELRGDAGSAGRLGVTSDISDQGCSLLWPEPLELGRELPIRIHFGPRSMEWTAEVTSEQGRQEDGWYRYGVRFIGLTATEADLVNDVVFNIVVPDYFTSLVQPSWSIRQWRRLVRALDQGTKSRAARQAVRVPVQLRHQRGGFVSTVRDLSESGLSVQSSTALAVGTNVTLTMVAQDRTWQGAATVARCEQRVARDGFNTWIVGLRFEQEQPSENVDPFRRWDAA